MLRFSKLINEISSLKGSSFLKKSVIFSIDVSVLQRDVRIIKNDMGVLKDKVIDLEEGQKQLRVLIEDDIICRLK